MSAVQAKALNCPNCGAAFTLRGFAHTLTIACPQCQSVLDAKDPHFQIIQKSQARPSRQILIPLGTRGKVRGQEYQVIGFQERTIHVEGVDYSWSEYLLFNPYRGFLYLTEYNGHWNLVQTLRAVPQTETSGRRPYAFYQNRRFSHFQTAEASTTHVSGEFPWRVEVGESAKVMDFIAPPQMLSMERTGEDINWSLGEYVSGREIWRWFGLPGSPPHASGVYANQPSPYAGRTGRMWSGFAYLVLALMVLAIGVGVAARDEEVFRRQYAFHPGATQPFVTDVFELPGRPSNVQVDVRTDLENNWAVFAMALINEQTGHAYDFGREVSRYSGRDSDGAWTEGSRSESVTLAPVPAGRYYLRIEAEMEANAAPMNYEIAVKRDVPNPILYLIAALALLVPPIFTSIRGLLFNHKRWQESDYGS